jgi:hypothetical protein
LESEDTGTTASTTSGGASASAGAGASASAQPQPNASTDACHHDTCASNDASHHAGHHASTSAGNSTSAGYNYSSPAHAKVPQNERPPRIATSHQSATNDYNDDCDHYNEFYTDCYDPNYHNDYYSDSHNDFYNYSHDDHHYRDYHRREGGDFHHFHHYHDCLVHTSSTNTRAVCGNYKILMCRRGHAELMGQGVRRAVPEVQWMRSMLYTQRD